MVECNHGLGSTRPINSIPLLLQDVVQHGADEGSQPSPRPDHQEMQDAQKRGDTLKYYGCDKRCTCLSSLVWIAAS